MKPFVKEVWYSSVTIAGNKACAWFVLLNLFLLPRWVIPVHVRAVFLSGATVAPLIPKGKGFTLGDLTMLRGKGSADLEPFPVYHDHAFFSPRK